MVSKAPKEIRKNEFNLKSEASKFLFILFFYFLHQMTTYIYKQENSMVTLQVFFLKKCFGNSVNHWHKFIIKQNLGRQRKKFEWFNQYFLLYFPYFIEWMYVWYVLMSYLAVKLKGTEITGDAFAESCFCFFPFSHTVDIFWKIDQINP